MIRLPVEILILNRGFFPACMLLAAMCSPAADWNPRLAAVYLDSRQEQWFNWPVAQSPGGPCVSCHTGATYLLARPLLRKSLGQFEPTHLEKGLLEGMRYRLAGGQSMFPSLIAEPKRTQALSVEAILTVLTANKGGLSAADTKLAWDRVFGLQQRTGKQTGSWAWFDLGLDPWESEHSDFLGTALAAISVGSAVAYKVEDPYAQQSREMIAYLIREYSNQPLHNRIMALWASAKLRGVLDKAKRHTLAGAIWDLQRPDGGWTTAALGPWQDHPSKPPVTGSDAYATGFVTFVLQQAGIGCQDPRLGRARMWLASHQNSTTGAWPFSSMNKRYQTGSMQVGFMDDAATGFAVLALLDQGSCVATTNNFRTPARVVHQEGL